MRQLVANRIKCLVCDDIIESLTRHDFKSCSCGSVSIDGGLDYQRISYTNEHMYQDESVYSDEPFEMVRLFAYRTGYGKPSAKDYGKFRKTLVCDMTDEHLQASLDYVGVLGPKIDRIAGIHWQILLQEKLYRIENEITKPE